MLDLKLKFKPGHTNPRDWMAPAALKQLCWNVTYACNYRCGICFTDAGRPAAGELTTAEAQHMLRGAAAAGVRDVIISGGEPFARADLIDLLRFMAGLGLTARIATNGSLLTEAQLAALRRDTKVKSFQVSLDTLDPGAYARVHGVPETLLPQALTNLALMQQYGFHTTVSARATPDTLPGLTALLERAAAEHWATLTIHCPVPTRRTRQGFSEDTDLLTLLEPALEHFARLPGAWLVETYIPWAPYHPVMQRLTTRIGVVHRGCAAGRDRLTVNPCGDISPCVCLDTASAYVGNVRQHDLAKVFAESALCRMLRSPQAFGICADCRHVASCGGGCRAAAVAVTGRLDGRDPGCPLSRARHR